MYNFAMLSLNQVLKDERIIKKQQFGVLSVRDRRTHKLELKET